MKVVVHTLGVVVLALATGRCSAGEEARIGRFDVISVDDTAILIDTATGDTWLLEKSPSADNESGHVWLKIPSPFAEMAPIEMSEVPSVSVKTPLRPPVDIPATPPSASPVPLTLEMKSPSKIAIGDSAMFALHIASDKASTISEVCIQLPSSLEPRQATQDYQRDGSSFVWRDVECLPDRISAHGIQADAKQPDKKAVVRCTATIDGKVFEVEKLVVIQSERAAKEQENPSDKPDDTPGE